MENLSDQLIFNETNYDKILDNFRLDLSQRAYVFIDEIQNLKNTPSVVKYLSDHYNIKFFLTGSASFYIKNMFSESLSGRKFIFEMFPFSFKEFLIAKNILLPKDDQPTKYIYTEYERYFDEYSLYGGFPKVVMAKNDAEKKEQLNDVFSSYWSLEVERLSDFRKKDKVRDLIFLLMERSGNKIDVSKLASQLGLTRNTIMEYLSFFEDTYLISTISLFSTSRDAEIRGAKKMYFCDMGILNQFSRVDKGSVFENACYNLLRHHGKVQYHQKKDGQEIDFIVEEKTAYEVKLTATLQDIKTLSRRAENIGIKNHKLISQAYSEDSNVIYGFLL